MVNCCRLKSKVLSLPATAVSNDVRTHCTASPSKPSSLATANATALSKPCPDSGASSSTYGGKAGSPVAMVSTPASSVFPSAHAAPSAAAGSVVSVAAAVVSVAASVVGAAVVSLLLVESSPQAASNTAAIAATARICRFMGELLRSYAVVHTGAERLAAGVDC